MCGTKTVLLIAVLGFLTGRPEFLDLALIYVLINFISTVAILKFRPVRELLRTRAGEPPLTWTLVDPGQLGAS